MATSIMQIRIDNDLKKEATAIFEELGLDLPTAIRVFLKKSVKDKGIPFDLRERAVPNDAINAMLALNENAHKNGNNNEMEWKLFFDSFTFDFDWFNDSGNTYY